MKNLKGILKVFGFKRFNIRLTIATTSIMIISISALSITSYKTLKDMMTTNSQEYCFSYASSASDAFTTAVNKVQSKTLLMLNQLSNTKNNESLTRWLNDYMQINSEFKGISFRRDKNVLSVGNVPIASDFVNNFSFLKSPIPPFDTPSYILYSEKLSNGLIYIGRNDNDNSDSLLTAVNFNNIVVPNKFGTLFLLTEKGIITINATEGFDNIKPMIPKSFFNDRGSMWIDDYNLTYVKNAHTGWYFCFVSNYDKFYSGLSLAKCIIFALAILLVIISFVASFLIFFKLTKPLINLNNMVKGIDSLTDTISYESKYSNISLKVKMFIAMAINTTALSIIFACLLFFLSRSIILNQTKSSLEMVTEQTANNVSLTFKDIEDLNWSASLLAMRSLNDIESSISLNDITNSLHYILNSGIVRIYDKNGKILYSNLSTLTQNQLNVNSLGSAPTHWRTFKDNLSNETVISYTRKIWADVDIKSEKQFGEPVEYVEVCVYETLINKNYIGTGFGNNMFVTSDEGKIISSSNKNIIGYPSSQIEMESKNHILAKHNLPFPLGWEFTSHIPFEKLLNSSYNILTYSFLVMILTTIFCFLLSFIITSRIVARISKLKTQTNEVEYYNLTQNWSIAGNDEVTQLSNSFNLMLKRLNTLIEDHKKLELLNEKQERRKKELELDMYQSQIDSHFLFNSISSVNFLIMSNKNKRAVDMLSSIAILFKKIIHKDNIEIPIREELEHALAYMKLQQIRFENRFEVVWNVPNDIMDDYMLRFVLQPLLENCIFHSVEMDVDSQHCKITVDIFTEDNLYIVVSDNGIGINPQRLSEIRHMISTGTTETSIALVNINERIKIYYGEKYSLSITSEEGIGTIVTITLPILHKGD